MKVLKFPSCPLEGDCVCAIRALAGGATAKEIRERNAWAEMLANLGPSMDDLSESTHAEGLEPVGA